MRRSLRTIAPALAVGLVLLAGCSGEGSSSGASSADGGGAAAPAPAGPGGTPGTPGAPAATDRQVVTTATASVSVADPATGAQRVSELVEAAGGRVEQRTEQRGSGESGTDGAAAELVVRVPADALTGLLADLDDLGDVADVSVARSDVTATAVDLDARISALQTSVGRLQTLMGTAGTTDALLSAERELSTRQGQLESLQSQRALLADQVELSTLTVHLTPFGVAPAGGPDGFGEGVGTGWRALVSVLGAAVVVLGVALPWLALGALVAVAVWVPVRVVRRRVAVPTPAPGPPGS